MPRPTVPTPWTRPDAYSGECSSRRRRRRAGDPRVGGAPVLNPVPDATWGLHLVDANIALGNLTSVAGREIKSYLKAGA